jgi:hypothetical protein
MPLNESDIEELTVALQIIGRIIDTYEKIRGTASTVSWLVERFLKHLKRCETLPLNLSPRSLLLATSK